MKQHDQFKQNGFNHNKLIDKTIWHLYNGIVIAYTQINSKIRGNAQFNLHCHKYGQVGYVRMLSVWVFDIKKKVFKAFGGTTLYTLQLLSTLLIKLC